MLDFNTKKDILRRLRKTRTENKLMWLPCAVAAAFVKIWYAIVCHMGMVLSDKDGNLLGVKGLGEKKKSRRQDDIVYVKRPFLGRVMSAVLAVSFVMMIMPELGMDIFAADISSYITVDGVDYYFHPEGSTADVRYYYPKALYDYAINASVVQATDPKYLVSNSAVRIFWNPFVLAAPTGLEGDINFQGYDIRVYKKGGGNVLFTGTATGDATQFDIDKSVFSDVNDATEYAVAVVPRFKIRRSRLEGATIDPSTGDILGTPSMSRLEQIDFDVTSNNETCKYQDIGRLNATLDIPALQPIENSAGGAVTLKWSPVMQNGGKPDSSNRYADGYAIYRKVISSSNTSYVKVAETGGNVGADGLISYTDENSIQYGTHYKYFVEAYKIIWDDTGRNKYDLNNYGMITSSGSQVRDTADQKAATIYASTDSYVAPYRPNIEVKDDPSSNAISLKWSFPQGRGGSDGVVIYRSIGMIDPENIPEVVAGSISFGEWIRQQANLDDGGLYKVEGVDKTYFPNNETSKDDKNIMEGVTYWYYIMSYLEKEDDTYLYSRPARASSLLKLSLDDTTITTVPGDGKIDVSWAPVEGAQGYILKIEQNSKYDIVTDTIVTIEPPILINNKIQGGTDLKNVTSYSHTRIYNGEQYTYSVMPYINIQSSGENGVDSKVWGDYSEPRKERAGLPISAPLDVKATTKDGEATVTWSAVSGATGYTLYWKNTTKGTEGKITGIPPSRTSNTQTMLSNGDTYLYHVTAYKVITGDRGDQTIESADSNTVPIKIGIDLAAPQDLKAATKDGEVTVTWGKVDGAQGYTLYFKKGQDSSNLNDFTPVNVSGLTYTQTGLKNGDVYTYKVLAYKRVNEDVKESPLSTPVSIKVGIDIGIPQDIKVSTKDGEITVTWAKVTGAEGYLLFYDASGNFANDLSSKKYFDVKGTSFNHTGLTNGDTHTYYVVAYKEVSGERVYSEPSVTITKMVGDKLDTPKDFKAVTTDGKVNLTWTASKGAEGYIVYAYSNGMSYQFDVSKNAFEHSGLLNGESWTYYVAAYKTVNGVRSFSPNTRPISVTIGVSLNSAVDLIATAGNHQIDLSWTAVKGAEGYVVYLYNNLTAEFDALSVTSKNSYSHVGLRNGQRYTYMIAAFKTINGERVFGEYSMAVTAIPTTGSTTDIDRTLNVKGTAPYGISHSEYISARCNHDAFEESVDVYFTTNTDSTQAVKDVLQHYADGLSSFIIYPFDISIYKENTLIKVDPADGYTVTITMPIPDRLIAYRDYMTIVHINENVEVDDITMTDWTEISDQRLEVLPCAIVDIDNVWCVQFQCTSFSPYAIVIYRDHIQDVSSGGGVADGSFAGNFDSGVLLFTALPDIMPNNKKLRVVHTEAKKYKIKSIEKR